MKGFPEAITTDVVTIDADANVARDDDSTRRTHRRRPRANGETERDVVDRDERDSQVK